MNKRSKFLILLLLALAIPLLQACGDAGAWEGTITDSAGVAVVHNTGTPMWGSGDEWTVTEDLKIGSVAGEREYQFGLLGLFDVAADGTIFAPDVQAQEVRAYDQDGNYLRTLGGPGSGPGELALGAAFVFVGPDGEVVVPDLGNTRVNRYAPSGEPIGSFPIQIEAGIPALFDLDSSGRLIAQLRGLAVPGVAALEDGDPLVVYDTTGVVVDTLALLPKGQTAEIVGEQVRARLFAPEPVWELDAAGSIFYAMNDQYKIFVNGPDGELTRIITRDVAAKPVSEADKEAIFDLMRRQYAQLGIPAAQVEQGLQTITFSETFPVFGAVFTGPENTLWVQRIQTASDMADEAEEGVEFDPQDLGSPEWEVFDAEGRYLGVVTFPERFSPRRMKGDQIYGVWRDEFDVQYIMRVKLTQGPS